MSLKIALNAIKKLSKPELKQVKARVDFLLQTSKSEEKRESLDFMSKIYKELSARYTVPDLKTVLATDMGKMGSGLQKGSEQVKTLCEELKLNGIQTAKLCRVLIAATEDYLGRVGVEPNPRSIILQLANCHSILYEAFPGYFGSDIFKNILDGKL